MSSHTNPTESVPNKRTQLRFHPSKKRIRLANLRPPFHDDLNFQVAVTLVIVCMMLLVGFIMQPEDEELLHRRRLPFSWGDHKILYDRIKRSVKNDKDNPNITEHIIDQYDKDKDRPTALILSEYGYFLLGKFKTRNAGVWQSWNVNGINKHETFDNRNKYRYYFYKRYSRIRSCEECRSFWGPPKPSGKKSKPNCLPQHFHLVGKRTLMKPAVATSGRQVTNCPAVTDMTLRHGLTRHLSWLKYVKNAKEKGKSNTQTRKVAWENCSSVPAEKDDTTYGQNLKS